MTRKQALETLLAKIEAGATWPEISGSMVMTAVGMDNVAIFRNALGSLDAALALHEAVLPDASLLMAWENGRTGFSVAMGEHPNISRHSAESFDNPARALLMADIKALIARESER